MIHSPSAIWIWMGSSSIGASVTEVGVGDVGRDEI